MTPFGPKVGDIWWNAQGGGALVDRVRFILGVGTEIAFVKVKRDGTLARGGGVYGFNAFCDVYGCRRTDATPAQKAAWSKAMGKAWPEESE